MCQIRRNLEFIEQYFYILAYKIAYVFCQLQVFFRLIYLRERQAAQGTPYLKKVY
jgi:hypothetical protein